MARIGLIYVTGTLSTVFSLLSTVANGIFAKAICRELPDLGGLQVASVTGCALSCGVQGVLIIICRQRIRKGIRLRRKLEARLFIILGLILFLMAMVVAMALGFSSTRLGDIESTEQQKEVRRLFSLWCPLWGVTAFLQAVCFGALLYLDRKISRQEPNWHFPCTNRVKTRAPTRLDDDKTEILRHSTEQRQSLHDPRIHKKASSESSTLSKARLSRLSEDLESGPETLNERENRASLDSQTWIRRFSRRVPGLHDELVKLDSTHPSTTSFHRHSRSQSRSRSRDQSPDSLFERPIISDCRSIRAPSPALSVASSRRNTDAGEHNIHPLFRSDSPSAPPLAMPGTTVTASPLAGHTISMHTLRQIRSRSSLSRPRSRSLLVPYEEDEEAQERREADLHGIRRPSPIGHPRIYGCGLDGGSRTSLQDYGSRRHHGRSGRRGSSMPPCR
uniref:Uncharacterized protein n=1 Tax=Coccidioides posadasii RMSCC 3488 TaxID=454284 RepID=A0A0J6FD88_COCPO|nr:hypothetical protein CPAG_03565 [Coccidioides posadasii RMSCC 3488]